MSSIARRGWAVWGASHLQSVRDTSSSAPKKMLMKLWEERWMRRFGICTWESVRNRRLQSRECLSLSWNKVLLQAQEIKKYAQFFMKTFNFIAPHKNWSHSSQSVTSCEALTAIFRSWQNGGTNSITRRRHAGQMTRFHGSSSSTLGLVKYQIGLVRFNCILAMKNKHFPIFWSQLTSGKSIH